MTNVYYFTRTGTSKRIAGEIAAEKGVSPLEVTDRMSWKGPIGFVRGGYFAAKKKAVAAYFRQPDEGAEIILVMPLWVGGFPPAVKSFITKIGRERITLVVSAGSSALTDRDGFVKIVDLKGKDASGKGIV